MRLAFPLGVAIFLSIAYTRLAILFLQVRSGPEAVAQFSAAFRLVEPAQILPASILAAVFPAYAVALYRGGRAAQRLAVPVSLLLAAAGVLLALIFWLTGPWLVPLLYGPAFEPAVPVLQVLGFSIIFSFVNYSLTHYLIARGRQGIIGFFAGGMLAIHAVLTWLLIPIFGPVGPAISIIVAEALLFLGCLAAVSWPAVQPVGISTDRLTG
jgi:O-antigen/teichoic acid export membrane protein